MPFVLRPLSSGGKFQLVGETYVYGVMHGVVESMSQLVEWVGAVVIV